MTYGTQGLLVLFLNIGMALFTLIKVFLADHALA